MAIDLEGIDGLTEAMKAEIVARSNKQVEVLQGEHKTQLDTVKAEAAKAQETALQSQTEQLKQLEAAAGKGSANDEKWQAELDKQKAALEASKAETVELRNANAIDQAMKPFLLKVTDDPAAKQYMEGLLKSQIKVVDGSVVPQQVGQTMDGLIGEIIGDKANSRYIAAPKSEGGGAAGGAGGVNNDAYKNLHGMSKLEAVRTAQQGA